MKYLLYIAMLCMVLGCAGRKKTSSSATSDSTAITVTAVHSAEETSTQTRHYGDSLTGENYLAIGDSGAMPAPIHIESTGLKLALTLTPTYDRSGKLQGHKVKYQATAKEKAVTDITTKKLSEQSTAQRTEHSTTASQQAEQTNTRLGWRFWGACLSLILIVIFITYRYLKGLLP